MPEAKQQQQHQDIPHYDPEVVHEEAKIIKVNSESNLPAPRSAIEDRELIQRRVEAFTELRNASIMRMSPSSFSDQGGKPYMDSNAAEVAARVCGANFQIIEGPTKTTARITFEDHEGNQVECDTYTYEAKVIARIGATNDFLEDIGTCSSFDKFFGWDSKKKLPLPLYRVDETQIRKKCIANAKARALKSLLGLDGLSWDDLKKIRPELTPENCGGRVDFNKGGSKAADTDIEPKSNLMLKDFRRMVGTALLEAFNDDKDLAGNWLAEATSWKKGDEVIPGKKSAKDVSLNQGKFLLPKVQAIYKQNTGKDLDIKSFDSRGPQ